MKKEYDNYLCRAFPKMYRNRNKGPEETCLYWGLAVGDGWYNIIHGLSLMIQSHIDNRTRERWRIRQGKRKYAKMSAGDQIRYNHLNDDMPKRIKQVIVDQVKEKFGTLRFYYHGGDKAVGHYVNLADAMSSITCEDCGAPGKIGGAAWVSVKCDKCRISDEIVVTPINKDDIEGK